MVEAECSIECDTSHNAIAEDKSCKLQPGASTLHNYSAYPWKHGCKCCLDLTALTTILVGYVIRTACTARQVTYW